VAVVELRDVTKKFSNRRGEVTAVDNVSFNVNSGEVLGILGPNGAGKTTTLRMIVTIYKPDDGMISIDGVDVVKNPVEARKRIAYMTQEPDLFPRLTVREYITYYFGFRGLRKGEAALYCDRVLELFDLREHANKKPFQLSTGLKRRVQLACVLSSDVPVVFLDEPTAGVDPKSKRDTWEIIREKLRENGMTVLITSHDLYEVEYLANRVVIMNHGKIVAEGSPTELKRKFGKTVRITLEEPIASFDPLRTLLLEVGSVREVIPTGGNSFEVHIKSIEDSINDVIQVMVSQGVRIRDISTATATFEDVYLDLLGGEAGGA